MSDLLSDFLNDRIEPVPMGGTVNGVLEYDLSDEDWEAMGSEPESDTEQKEYVKRELQTYVPEPQVLGGLTDIDDGREESFLGSVLGENLNVPKVFGQYKFENYYKKQLPIDSYREKILDLIDTNSVVIIHGPTGCGKTTQVPQYILDNCRDTKSACNIVVTQPRRIAAINISQRVCEERGWAIGTVCGYQVGLDKVIGEDVILTYVTTEVLLQKLITHKTLNRFTHIIIDEVHERSKTLDFLLLIVRKYHFTNSPSVKLILMSATMEADEFAFYFRGISRSNPEHYLLAPVLHVNKKMEYLTSIFYNESFWGLSAESNYNIDEPCITPERYELCRKLIDFFDRTKDFASTTNTTPPIGSVLVFLPGFHEIEEMHRILVDTTTPSQVPKDVIPLHSSLTSEHMARAFLKPKPGIRKVILSTNIAESSVTVPDVTYVIDFCLTKVMVVNEVTKFSTLSLQWASHNNCIQRAGRVGRVSDGRVYRLVPETFYETQMPTNTVPELQRAPLENVILYMKLLDLNDTPKNVLSLAISPPNLKDVESCVWHLKEVGALLQTCRGNTSVADGDLTFIGRVMGSLPIDIHLAKLILLGHMFSCLEETVIMAAGCVTRNIFVSNFRDRFKCYRKKLLWADGSCSDFMTLLNLYNVWLRKKRERSFRSVNEEMAWCKTNFVNLKGLREWDVLIREINSRLKRMGIERAVGVTNVQLSPVEKPTVLKVIICGAFYPHYFIRSSEFGQVDSKEAVRVLNGRDPFNTVYFTNMRPNHPGHIYVRQIKKLLRAENNVNVQIGFDSQSSKVFVEYKNVKQPEQITVEGRNYVTMLPGNIPMDVYEAIRKRQLNVRFHLEILQDHQAWEFANSTEDKLKRQNSSNSDDVNCFSFVNYSPLPTLDMEYMTVTISHVVDAGHFYCQHWNDETRILLDKIFVALNGPGVFLEPVEGKVQVSKVAYAAMYEGDGKFYRCRVECIVAGQYQIANVLFVDYGNAQKVPTNLLYCLPSNPECHVDPIAMCCQLSEIQPNLVMSPRGVWSDRVTQILRRKTEGVLLNARVYSVVDDVAHLELFPQKPGPRSVSFNQWLVNEDLAQRAEESRRSKMDHETRLVVLSSENPTTANELAAISNNSSYSDFDEPSSTLVADVLQLKGPFSPLEMRVCGLVAAGVGATVRVEGDSVNAVLLDDNPEDPHARLMVAGHVTQSDVNNSIKIAQTTVMPSIPGLPMLMTLLFCPRMEPKITPDGSRVASVLCGLGCKEQSMKANFPTHDISLVLDTELKDDIIIKVNELRHFMNLAVKTMENIADEIAYPTDLFSSQKMLKEKLFNLLHLRQKSVERVNIRCADIWNKSSYDSAEVLRMNMNDKEDDIWPLLWFVKLSDDKYSKISLNKNLEEMDQIAKRLTTEKPIVCELCNSASLNNISDVRIHLFRQEHKAKLAKYQQENKQKEKE